jgi:hypothetical protein
MRICRVQEAKASTKKLAIPKPSFIQFIRQSPLVKLKLHLRRNRSLTR